MRVRIGRGGRRIIDRRLSRPPRVIASSARSELLASLMDSEDSMDVDSEEEERQRRLEAQWRFDSDDQPAIGPQGNDEQDRVLVDDFDSK